MSTMDAFEKDLEGLLNRHSRENESNTPDFVLARYLVGCLHAWNAGLTAREEWYGRPMHVAAHPSVSGPKDPR